MDIGTLDKLLIVGLEGKHLALVMTKHETKFFYFKIYVEF